MSDAPIFEAELVPHRSLSTAGMWTLIGFLLTISLAVTTLFWWLGAWPVAGFNGADLLLAALLLRANARGRRAREILRLHEHDFHILRFDERGAMRQTRLRPDWLTVSLKERNGRVPGLYLHAEGREEEVATRLGEEEKRDLAQALQAALHRWRHPRFDNPQLRDLGSV